MKPAAKILEAGYQKNISENALLLFYTIIKMHCLDQRFSLHQDREGEALTSDQAASIRESLENRLPASMDMKNAALNGTALPGMVFRNVDFSGTGLENGLFTHAGFEKVVFSGSNLQAIDL